MCVEEQTALAVLYWPPAVSGGAFATSATHPFSQLTLLTVYQAPPWSLSTSEQGRADCSWSIRKVSRHRPKTQSQQILLTNREMIDQVFLDLSIGKVELQQLCSGQERRWRWKTLSMALMSVCFLRISHSGFSPGEQLFLTTKVVMMRTKAGHNNRKEVFSDEFSADVRSVSDTYSRKVSF